MGVKAIKNFKEMQPGDIEITISDSSRIKDWIDFAPKIKIEEGIESLQLGLKIFMVIIKFIQNMRNILS